MAGPFVVRADEWLRHEAVNLNGREPGVRQLCVVISKREDDLCVADFCDVFERRSRGDGGILRDVAGARFECGEHSDDHRDSSAHVERNRIARVDAEPNKCGRQGRRMLIELVIGDCRTFVMNRRRIGLHLCPVLEGFVDKAEWRRLDPADAERLETTLVEGREVLQDVGIDVDPWAFKQFRKPNRFRFNNGHGVPSCVL